MKKSFLIIVAMAVLSACSDNSDPSAWSTQKIDKWFEKGDWLNGWKVKPDESINRKAFAISYFKNRERWDKAFTFLKNSDLSVLELKRYDIDDDNVYAPVSEYLTKNEADARYEAHQKYIDIQYVVSGKELIGIAPVSQKNEVLEPYDATKDIEFLNVSGGENRTAMPDRFFIFFPDDAHRPGLKDGESSPVRKVVVKVKVD
ncbi:MAG: YhcH/YjgK/YiaL family protein [Bacteroidota bacterium]|nr:YhcH/YjgK/YiaL family protein [Bacteroidota bacterium]